MDGLAASCCAGRFVPIPSAITRSTRSRPSFLALAASSPSPDGPEFDERDLAELKFGRMIGEDPKLTLAKIMARKANPDMSYVDFEKEFRKKKGKYEIVEIPLDWSKKEMEPSNPSHDEKVQSKGLKSGKGLALVRPVMKKGTRSGLKANSALDGLGIETSQSSQKTNTKSTSASNVTLRKPSVLRADDTGMEKSLKLEIKPSSQGNNTKSTSASNVTLRKPSVIRADDTGTEKSLKIEIKPNFYLKMRKDLLNKTKDSSGNFSKVSLLKKPEPIVVSANSYKENVSSADAVGSSSGKASLESSHITLPKKLDQIRISTNSNRKNESSADGIQLSSSKVSVESSNVSLSKKPEPVRMNLNSSQENTSSADDVQSGKVSMESSNVTPGNNSEPIGISLNSNQENASSSGAVSWSSGTVGMESSNVTLSKKPELSGISSNSNQETLSSVGASGSTYGNVGVESSKVTLSKKPEAIEKTLNSDKENMPSANAVWSNSAKMSLESANVALSKKPEPIRISLNSNQENMPPADAVGLSTGMSSIESVGEGISAPSPILDQDKPKDEKETSQLNIGLQRRALNNSGSTKMGATIKKPVDLNSVQSSSNLLRQAAVQGKPQRLEPPAIERPDPNRTAKMDVNDEIHKDAEDITHFLSTELGEQEEKDWSRAKDIFQKRRRAEVEVISSSSRGFVVSFGSLVGFLPYRNLGTRWKFLAFETWVKKKGLDLSLYRNNLGIIGNYEIQNRNLVLDSDQNPEMVEQQLGDKPAADIKFEDLLEAYDQEKTKFLSSFVGQRINVHVILADRNSRKLFFSTRLRENQEITEKKRSLMAKLSIGDVVKCCITKIKYFGIFVEVEGVPALIHQSEVSWDATLDPSAYFKIGQIVEAKVHQLDFALERITLSLKEVTPDPLVGALETLESVIGDHNDGSGGAAQANVEWPDVESLIKELKKIEGIDCVSKGQFSLSPGLAPTFQVYMGSVLDNEYKLLARSGNKVQEVIVQASLDKDQMKAAILTCTNRVE